MNNLEMADEKNNENGNVESWTNEIKKTKKKQRKKMFV